MFEDVKNSTAGKFISHGEWKHPDRVIDSYEIIFVTKGNVYINENGVEYPLKANEVLILEPGVRHYGYAVSTETEFFWLHWRAKTNAAADIKHRRIENPYSISLYFRQLIDSRITHKPAEALDYLTRLILIEVYFNSKRPDINPVTEKIAAWIKANNNTCITEKQIADIFGYNPDYLNRLFKASFSKTIKQYINDERMSHIKTLMLLHNLPLKEIAAKSGFTEYKYFLKFFKYHEKATPTEFYKQYAKIHINSH